MKLAVVAILLFGSLSACANPRVEIFFESTSSGFEIFASNDEPCPVSVQFTFELVNLKTTDKSNFYLIPAKTKNYKVTDLVIDQKTRSYTFQYTTSFNYGDHTQENYDITYDYHLPYEKGKEFIISQGYYSKESHSDKFAIDFQMPIGTKILAARGGTIVQVVDDNDKSCPSKECEQYNNWVLVYHSDGTFGKYMHIQKDGALVEVGDEVERGDPIAMSGNVGWSSGPHLHFEVYLQRLESVKTVRTNFLVDDGDNRRILSENQRYLRNY